MNVAFSTAFACIKIGLLACHDFVSKIEIFTFSLISNFEQRTMFIRREEVFKPKFLTPIKHYCSFKNSKWS